MIEEIDFPTTSTYGKDVIKRVQVRLLEMARETVRVLDSNGFKYFICFGTLLGAVRHKGFIPWDDDFDMFLFDDEYDDAIACLRKHLPPNIIVHDRESDPIYWPAWSRLRDIGSRVHSVQDLDDEAYKYKGINLDLYRIKRVNRGCADLYRRRENIEFLVRKNTVGLVQKDQYSRMFDEWVTDYTHLLSAKRVCADDVFAFTVGFKQGEIDDILPLQKIMFEGYEFFAPHNIDAVLRHIYGDYMMIPEYSKRKPHYDRVLFNIKEDDRD